MGPERFLYDISIKYYIKMVSKTLSVSIPDDMMGFLDENAGLSPSKLLQNAIESVQNSLKSNPQLIEANKTIQRLEKIVQRIQTDLCKATDFITDNDLWETFIDDNQKKIKC